MNIAFVNATSSWGGVKTWMLEFGAGLVRRGHCVRVFGRQPEFVRAAEERVGHGQVMAFGADLNPFAVARFMRVFREQGTEVVILNVGKDIATAGVAAKLRGIPVVQRIGLPDDIPLRVKSRLLHQWIRPCFLSPCRYIAEGFARSLPYLDGFEIKTILNARAPATYPLVQHTPRKMVMTQQLFADKGHAVILRSLARLVAKGDTPPFELHVVGTGGEEAALKALAASLGVSDRVYWHGFSTAVAEHLAQADIFVLASLEEGLPNTLLEALAAGLLPVARNVGGVAEVFPADLDRWLLPFEADEAVFATALGAALRLSDDELVRQRGLARTGCTDPDVRVAELEAWLSEKITASRE